MMNNNNIILSLEPLTNIWFKTLPRQVSFVYVEVYYPSAYPYFIYCNSTLEMINMDVRTWSQRYEVQNCEMYYKIT